MKAILRRTMARAEPPAAAILESGPIRLDPERHAVSVGGADVALTPSEFKLLQTMMQAPGKVFSRDELLDRLYDNGGSWSTASSTFTWASCGRSLSRTRRHPNSC